MRLLTYVILNMIYLMAMAINCLITILKYPNSIKSKYRAAYNMLNIIHD